MPPPAARHFPGQSSPLPLLLFCPCPPLFYPCLRPYPCCSPSLYRRTLFSFRPSFLLFSPPIFRRRSAAPPDWHPSSSAPLHICCAKSAAEIPKDPTTKRPVLRPCSPQKINIFRPCRTSDTAHHSCRP